LEIRDHEGEVVGSVYQRVLNEREIEKARLSALRATRSLRLELRNESANEYAALMENILQLDKPQKINVIMLEEMSAIYDRARKNADLRMPSPLLGDATLEEVENYEAAVDDYDEKVTQQVTELANKYTKELRAELEELSDEDFAVKVLHSMENQICVNFMSSRFVEEINWRSVYADPKFKNNYFRTYDEFDELAEETKEQLSQGYKGLQLHRGLLKN